MKKTLMILGMVLLAITVVAAAVISIIVVKGNELDKESKEYADAAILAVISGWDKNALKTRASIEFTSRATDNDLERLLGVFRMLGKLKEYKGCKGQATLSVTMQHGKVVTADYVGQADFEKGPADVHVTLIKHGDQWQILGFGINSKQLLSPA